MATVLLYNIREEARRRKIGAALFRAALPFREVTPEEQGKTLGELLGVPGAAEAAENPGEPFAEEMIVMHGLNPRQFQTFLEALKQQQIRVPLKAVVTEHNIQWSSLRLHSELAVEHRAMTEGKAPVH